MESQTDKPKTRSAVSGPRKRKRPYKIEDFYEPFPRQKEFHDSAAKYRLFGGAAGPGKTKALLYEAILQAHKHPGVDTLLLRRTFPELEASLHHVFSARCAARAVRQVQRSEAHRHVAQRLDDAVCLLRHRKRCVPLPGRGISFHRRR